MRELLQSVHMSNHSDVAAVKGHANVGALKTNEGCSESTAACKAIYTGSLGGTLE